MHLTVKRIWNQLLYAGFSQVELSLTLKSACLRQTKSSKPNQSGMESTLIPFVTAPLISAKQRFTDERHAHVILG